MRWLFLVLLLIACTQQLAPQEAINRCVETCRATVEDFAKNQGHLDSQCLGEIDPYWVCDIAHNPRQVQDNLPENQCFRYRDGSHTRFVELTADCSMIRTG